MKNEIKRFFLNNRYIFAAFWLPVILVLIALAATDIYPFGTQQIPVIDMYHQYVPFLSELQYKLQNGDSLFYTWDGAAGSNFWNLLAYYGASPLNLILALFPAKGLMEGVTVILLIKIGLAGAFMSIYLREKTGKCDIATSAFGTMYAMCAYVMGYYWCIMWLDSVFLLPLVIMGLERIIGGKGPSVYVVCLALTVFCNYYIAIMVCIFIFFYYPVTYFANTRWRGFKMCLKTTGKAVGFSLLGLAMAGIMLLPTYFSMQQTYYISSEMPDTWTFYNNAMDVFNQLLPNAQLTFRDGLPNVYSGLIVVILMVCYVTDRTIRLKEKSLYLGFLAFLFMSLNVNKLDFIWHGFHFPNELPYRYSFVVSFLLVMMAYKAFKGIDKVKQSTIWVSMAGILAWYIVGQRLLTDSIDDGEVYFYMGTALLLAYTAFMILYKRKYISKRVLSWVVTAVVAVEMGFSFTIGFGKVGNTDRDFYFENYDDVRALVEEVDDEIDRVEIDDNFILNTPALYHYKGVSQFSSSINAGATFTMEAIGVEGEPGKNRYNYNLTNPVTNAILDVKYLISKSWEIDDYDLTEISASGDSVLYENEYAPGIGYMTGPAIWSWDVNLDNPFSVLDDYVRAATDNDVESVFMQMGAEEVDSDNMLLEENGDDAWMAETVDDSGDSVINLTYRADETQKYYVFVEADNCRDITVYKDDSEDGIFIREDCGSIVNIGTIEAGSTFRIELGYDAGNMGSLVSHVAYIDQEAWDEAYGIISKETLHVTEWDERGLKGEITAEEDGAFVTAIPYENGWSMKVDGRERDADQQVGELFIATELSAGTHEIELKFTPPGIKIGAALTIISIIILILYGWVSRRHPAANILRKKIPGEVIAVGDTCATSATSPSAFEEPEEYPEAVSDYSTEDIHCYPEREQGGCPD